jgi:hypothetical protein
VDRQAKRGQFQETKIPSRYSGLFECDELRIELCLGEGSADRDRGPPGCHDELSKHRVAQNVAFWKFMQELRINLAENIAKVQVRFG